MHKLRWKLEMEIMPSYRNSEHVLSISAHIML